MRRILAFAVIFALACAVPATMAAAATVDAHTGGAPAGWWSALTDLAEGWVAALAASVEGDSTKDSSATGTEQGPSDPAEATDPSGPTESPDGEDWGGWDPWG